jgi:hypothetical protein
MNGMSVDTAFASERLIAEHKKGTNRNSSPFRINKDDIMFGEGDRVAVRWMFRGTYRGEAKPGLPNPGERCTIAGN